MRKIARCLGYDALAPKHSGPVYKYMASSPGCWVLYGSVLGWKDTVPGGDGTAAQRIVDTGAVQHPTNPAIAREAGVSKRLIWHYFTDGDDLMEQYAVAVADILLTGIATNPAVKREGPALAPARASGPERRLTRQHGQRIGPLM